MEIVEDQEIRNEAVQIDGKRFINCVLIDCILEYSGAPVSFEKTLMRCCRYVFFGEARSTVHFLQGVGLMDHIPGEWAEFSEQVH